MASLSASATRVGIRGRRPSRRWRDVIIAAGAFALTMGVVHARHGNHSTYVSGVLLAALSSFPLVAHRRAPLAVFAVTTLASAALVAVGDVMGPPVGPTCALFFVAASERCRARPELTGAVVIGFGAIHIAASATRQAGFPITPLLAATALWGGAWIAGDQVRQRRLRRVDLVERAERGKRETEHQRRLAAAEERTRIARDLHDSAAHAINVILVQAGAARLLQGRDPQAVQLALTTIEDLARETIVDIERLVRGLREDGSTEATGDRVQVPIGLAAIPTLVALHRAAGLSVALRRRGEPRALSPGLDQAAYRILQESMTNAARHGIGSADVEIAYGEGALQLTIRNPVSAPSNDGVVSGGHGIQGMRERAILLGGALAAGRGEGRFCVDASLPYAAAAGPGR